MREHKFIRKCPDGCGKDEYDLGTYRGFHLYQKPFCDGWWVYSEKVEPQDELDQLLIPRGKWHNEAFSAHMEIEGLTLEDLEKSIINQIDAFWVRKETLITKAKEGVFKVEPRED